MQAHFEQSVYDANAFVTALREVRTAIPIVDEAVDRMEPWRTWGFVTFDRYEVVLTLYGPGGSYESSTGRVTLFVDRDGKGRFGKPFAHTIVHEIVHIGVQKGIVEEKKLSHPDKERLVDRICVVAFADLLNGYRVQKMGNPQLDAYVGADSLRDLPAAVDRYRCAIDPASCARPRSRWLRD